MTSRPKDFFETELGAQAAVMNAWMLWQHNLGTPWSINDLMNALPCITETAIRPHVHRLLRDKLRGNYLMEIADGLYQVNPERSPI